jgi:maltooligosyltrehalose synthase
LDAPVTGLDTMRFLESAVGIWPDGGPADERELDSLRERLGDYLVKAAREAKQSTTWLDPDPAYERGLTGMVATSLASTTEPLVADITGFLSSIGPAAVTTSLALTVLRVTVPGVPDTYQGTETWARSLVDPDNRRPVPFARLAEELAAIDKEGRTPAAAATLLRNAGDGRVKMAVLSALLRHRRAHADLYASGAYVPLTVEGPAAGHVVAAARRGGDGTTSVTVVPRLPYRLSGPRRFPLGAAAWGETRVLLPGSWPDRWEGVVDGGPASADGGRLEVGGVLASLPVAVLVPRGC